MIHRSLGRPTDTPDRPSFTSTLPFRASQGMSGGQATLPSSPDGRGDSGVRRDVALIVVARIRRLVLLQLVNAAAFSGVPRRNDDRRLLQVSLPRGLILGTSRSRVAALVEGQYGSAHRSIGVTCTVKIGVDARPSVTHGPVGGPVQALTRGLVRCPHLSSVLYDGQSPLWHAWPGCATGGVGDHKTAELKSFAM